MEITARQIEDWSRGKNAQAALPRYIRRLIHSVGSIIQVAIPAGDSTSQPGWDGELLSEHGNAWVPRGRSFWELSCEAQVTSKANSDYDKRTKDTPEYVRRAGTLVIVTARRWSRKAKWLAEKLAASEWYGIRAYDADDIEQWMEQAPAVKLRFGDEIGVTGYGVEDVERHWVAWAEQTDTAITPEAIFVGRNAPRDRFLASVRGRMNEQSAEPLAIRADSVEEAAAFAAAALLEQPDLCSVAAVVTDAAGWRFVDQNISLRIAVAARPEIAEKPTIRKGTVVVLPYAAGDMVGHFKGTAGREDEVEIVLDRPDIHEFERALISIGLDEGDAKRLASITGRSWSVFRRRHAKNPSIRRPSWLEAPQASALSTLCLLGGWSGDKAADRSIVAELAGRAYEEFEQNLRYLAQFDDAPILKIGQVWKAKSSLELLDLFGERITRDELDRFFRIAERVLSTPDPELDLPNEERYAAQIHGKIRAESGLLVRAICDTLVKLAARGSKISGLAGGQIQARVSQFVGDLLNDAEGIRWLSLSSLLPDLAEAAPDAFIRSIERSLAKPEAPVLRLLNETGESGVAGRCWHAGMLWALERLAWAPERLTRVALLLARLARVKIKGNWGNSPRATLVDLFRSWLPQTAASLEQRIAAIDTLIIKEPDIAFKLLNDLLNFGPDSASPSARPNWRDDDAGAGRGVSGAERHGMLVAVADRLITSSKGNANRVTKLLDKISIFDPARVAATFALVEEFISAASSDGDREVLSGALRKRIYWQRNYGDLRGAALESHLGKLEKLYQRLTPLDPVVRHSWLFANSWPELPSCVRDEGHARQFERVEVARVAALKEIYEEYGFDGIEKIAEKCPDLTHVGIYLAKIEIDIGCIIDWIIENGGDFSSQVPMLMAIRGVLRASTPERAGEIIETVLDQAQRKKWGPDRIAKFLVQANDNRVTWDTAARLGKEVEDAYWRACYPSILDCENAADVEFVLQKFIKVGRSRSAFQICRYDFAKVNLSLLAVILEKILQGEEPDGPLLDSWRVGEALDLLEKSGGLERDRLIRLGFGLIPALGYEGEQRAISLYKALMSEPKLFTELLCLVYRPANREREEPITESTKAAAHTAWQVLHHCRRLPGTQADGRIDRRELAHFVEEARKLCKDADRLGVCDSTLGQILAHAPPDADGVWPLEAVRDLLDRPEMEEMRNGFVVGAMNKRGVTTRAYDEGGQQERELAAVYRNHARALHTSHVYVAEALEQLASSYENDGLREDLRAQLRKEGH